MGVVAGVIALLPGPAQAQDKQGGAKEAERHVEERPFAGPPPKHRAPRRKSDQCKAGDITCTLAAKAEVGAPCTCPDAATVSGQVVDPAQK